jgi:photosystem II stability/assembly factor-like uncharacterized protein
MRALASLLLVLAVVAACSPAPPDRATPDDAGDPTFLAVTNDALGPLLLGSLAGVYTSVDAGRSWSHLGTSARPALAMATTKDSVIITTGTRRLTYDLRLDRATADAQEWPDGRRVIALASIPSSRLIWALTSAEQPRLLRSRDDGRTWTPVVPTGLCHRPRGLAASASPGERPILYAACGPEGLLASRDDGLSFQRVPGIRTARDVATTLADRGMVVVATPLVRISNDLGATWRDAPLVANRVAIDPRNPALIFAIAPNGRLFASKDGGKTF